MKMNFLVLGAGAIGCYVGGRLVSAGQQVSFVGRPQVLSSLRAQGLRVTDLDGFRADLAPSQLALFESLASAWSVTHTPDVQTVILLCVKGGATALVAEELNRVCPQGTPVVSLQNGVDNMSRLLQGAPGLQAIAGMVPFNVVMPEHHQVHRATEGALHLDDMALTHAIASVFTASGLPTVLSGDMRRVQWGKLLLNLNNPVNALSDLPLQAQLRDRGYRRVLAALQKEALKVLAQAGIRPAKISHAPPAALPAILSLPNFLFERVATRMLRMDASARSSMWEDVQRGRTTEIDDLCGAVVRLAQAHGLTAPRNERMCQLILAHQPGQRWTSERLLRAINQSLEPTDHSKQVGM